MMLLVLGYYPDEFAELGLPPDLIFDLTTGSLDDIIDCAGSLQRVCAEKYKLPEGGLDPWDLFWTVSLDPTTASS